MENYLTLQERVKVLEKNLYDKDLKFVVEGAGIKLRTNFDKVAIHHLCQMKRIVAHARKTDNTRGRAIDDI